MAKTALIMEMIDRLRDHPGLTVVELSSSLSRSERTIYRWLNELSVEVGAPVYCKDGGYYLADNGRDNGSCLSSEELVAIRTSLKSAPYAGDSSMKQRAESAWRKIRETASSERLRWASEMDDSHSIQLTALEGAANPDITRVIENAIARHCRLRISYRSQKSNRIKQYLIDPYALAFRRHSWYLLAHCAEHGCVVQFKILRFKQAEEIGEHFSPPADFSVEDYFKGSWEAWAGGEPVCVRVRFSPKVSAMVAEAKRHPTQVTHEQPDGSVVFEATVSGVEEIAIWIMGFGKEAEVLAPQELRDYVAAHAVGMAQIYSG